MRFTLIKRSLELINSKYHFQEIYFNVNENLNAMLLVD